MKLVVSFQGGAEIDAMLRDWPAKVSRRLATPAVRAGARVIADEAKRQAPVETGALRKAIKVRMVKSRRRTERRLKVSIAGPEGALWHLIEFGTEPHVIKAVRKKLLSSGSKIYGVKVDHPGIRPQPFLRQAADSKMTEALEAMLARLRERVLGEAKAA